MRPESLLFRPRPDLNPEDFDSRSESNRRASQVLESLEAVLKEGGEREIVLGSKNPPYFTLNTDLGRGYSHIAGIHCLDEGTGRIMGGEVVLDYGESEKREAFMDYKEKKGIRGIDGIRVRITVDSERPKESYKFDPLGRLVLDVKIVSWQ